MGFDLETQESVAIDDDQAVAEARSKDSPRTSCCSAEIGYTGWLRLHCPNRSL
jgi:hypothetical protein